MLLGDENNLEDTLSVVDIDINLNPFENAKKYYEDRSKLIEKGNKTKEAAEYALKSAKEAAMKELDKHKKTVKVIKTNRKVMWFEKFYWFLSSENYLIISARDAPQNEMIIKKYLSKDDIVMHTQIQGSAFSIVKNPNGGEIPDKTLEQAAQATLCHSRSWTQKVVNDVYWVYASQISKTAPTGLSMGAGSFMIYGKKNFIRPKRLEMGFGFLFRIDEESMKRHSGERGKNDEENGDGQLQSNELPSITEDPEAEDQRQDTTTNTISVDETTELTEINFSVTGTGKQGAKKKKQKQQKSQAPEAKPIPQIQVSLTAQKKKQNEMEEAQKAQQSKIAKKRKMKKQKIMEEKYGGYTEEERKMMMELTGAKEIEEFESAEGKGQSKKAKRKAVLKERRELRKIVKTTPATGDKAKGVKEIEKTPKTEVVELKTDKTLEKEKNNKKKEIETKNEKDTNEENVEDGEEEEEYNDLEDINSTGANLSDKEDDDELDINQNMHETRTIAPSVIDQEQEEIINNTLDFSDLTGKPSIEGINYLL